MFKVLRYLTLFLSIFLISSCKKESSKSSDGSTKKIKLAFVTNVADDFWLFSQAGINDAVKEFGDIEVIFKVGDGTTVTQKKIVEDLIVSGVQAIAISPAKAEAQVRMIDDWSKDIKVLCVDSDSPASKRIAYLGTNNVAAGHACGKLIKEALPEGGTIMCFVGSADADNAKERYQGIQESLKDSNIKILDLRTDDADKAKARANAEDTLTNYSDINALVGLYAYNTPANYGAVKDAGKLGKIKLIGFDENPTTLKAIDEGHVYGTVVQDPYKFGYESMKALRSIMKGNSLEEAGFPENKLWYVPTKSLKKGDAMKHKDYCEKLKESLKN